MDVVEPETLSSALKVKDKEAGDVGKFLNRILGLNVHRQNLVGGCFRCFESLKFYSCVFDDLMVLVSA